HVPGQQKGLTRTPGNWTWRRREEVSLTQEEPDDVIPYAAESDRQLRERLGLPPVDPNPQPLPAREPVRGWVIVDAFWSEEKWFNANKLVRLVHPDSRDGVQVMSEAQLSTFLDTHGG